MIDLNKAIANNRFTVLGVRGDLLELAQHFSATGNNHVASRLRTLADEITVSASSLDHAWHNELNRVVQADSKALRDTLLAAFGQVRA